LGLLESFKSRDGSVTLEDARQLVSVLKLLMARVGLPNMLLVDSDVGM